MADRIDAFASAVEMLAALRARKVSAVELLDVHRRRIERHNPALNAIVEPDFDRARRDADAADARRARGEEVPLLGLPMTLKESINVRGLRTTVGMPGSQDFRSEHDAPVTVRVKAAGAAVMAKTNVPQMLADWQSANPVPALGQALAEHAGVDREDARRERHAGAGGAGTRLPLGDHARRPTGDGVSGRAHARRPAHRAPGDRPVPRGPHADPLHRARRSGVGRLHPSVRLRRRRLSGWNARSGAAVRGRMTAESATRPRNIALPCCAR